MNSQANVTVTARQLHVAQWNVIQALIDSGADDGLLTVVSESFKTQNIALQLPAIEDCIMDVIRAKDAELGIYSLAELRA